jgi:hypothetical protein
MVGSAETRADGTLTMEGSPETTGRLTPDGIKPEVTRPDGSRPEGRALAGKPLITDRSEFISGTPVGMAVTAGRLTPDGSTPDGSALICDNRELRFGSPDAGATI